MLEQQVLPKTSKTNASPLILLIQLQPGILFPSGGFSRSNIKLDENTKEHIEKFRDKPASTQYFAQRFCLWVKPGLCAVSLLLIADSSISWSEESSKKMAWMRGHKCANFWKGSVIGCVLNPTQTTLWRETQKDIDAPAFGVQLCLCLILLCLKCAPSGEGFKWHSLSLAGAQSLSAARFLWLLVKSSEEHAEAVVETEGSATCKVLTWWLCQFVPLYQLFLLPDTEPSQACRSACQVWFLLHKP